jgi:hypothetical protein
MIDLRHLLVEQERQEEMRRNVEKQRLVKQALAAKPNPSRFYDPLLAGLGRSLTHWGVHLQARYSAMVEVPAGHYHEGKFVHETLSARTKVT